MKLSEIKVGSIYAVVPSWGYNSSSARDINRVKENDVIKAELISTEKHEYQPSQRYKDMTQFKKAQQGERSVGVIMKAVDNNGSDYYWTARLADVVAEWSQLEPIWKQRQSEQDEAERLENEKRAKANAIKRNAEAHVERLKGSVPNSISELIGQRCGEVIVHTNGYGEQTTAVATINLSDLETLIELAYDGKAQVA
jgi:hypothetical protein